MGNDLVGKVFDVFKEYRPSKTIMKIWNKDKVCIFYDAVIVVCIILAVKDPAEWQMEMDPYYIFVDGKVDGISYLDNAAKIKRITKPEYLIYHDTSLD